MEEEEATDYVFRIITTFRPDAIRKSLVVLMLWRFNLIFTEIGKVIFKKAIIIRN